MRPLEDIGPEEWAAYYKRNRGLRLAWVEIRPYLRSRDARSTKRMSFIFGWAAAERHHRALLLRLKEQLGQGIEKLLTEYEQKTGIYLLD